MNNMPIPVAGVDISKRFSDMCILNPVLAAYFEKKRASKPRKVAICAVMHKIVNIVFAVLRDQKPSELRLPEDHDRMLKERHKPKAA